MDGLLGLLGQFSGVAAFITAVLGVAYIRAENRKRNAEAAEREANADKSGQEGSKLAAEAGVIAEGTPLEWRTTDHQALLDERAYLAETRARADKAEAEARAANKRADECRRDRDDDRELIADLRREFDQLLNRIASCPAGHICPVADSLTTRRH